MNKSIWTPLFIAKSALIAALYVAVTGLWAPLSFINTQVRIADALVVLALYTMAAVPGLTVGCFIANILWSPFGFWDCVIGPLATFIGVALAYMLRKNRPVALFPTVVSNSLLVPLVFLTAGQAGYLLNVLWIAVSQLIACYAIGWPLSKVVDKYGLKFIKSGGEA